MKPEQPKIESTIEEIKKSASEMEVKNAAEEFETEAVAEAIKNEMPIDNKDGKEGEDELETTAETETLVSEMELNPEAKERRKTREKLIEYLEKIDEVGKKYSTVYKYFEIYGSGGRSYDEEFDDFLEKRKEDPEYCPTFEYPEIEKLDLEKVNIDKETLSEVKKELDKEENCDLKIICEKAIENIEDKIAMLESVKNRNFDNAFKYAVKAYGDINDELVKNAQSVYKAIIEKEKKSELKPEKESEIEKQLKSAIFTPEDFKSYFEMLIKKAGFEKDGWEVVITPKVKSLDVSSASKDYDHPVVRIPEKREEEVDGLKFIKLLNHEFTHIITQTYNRRNGLGGVNIGVNYETFTEGIAKISEKEAEEEVFERPEPESAVVINAHPYYVLGIKKIKEGANFPQTFDYLFELYKKELEYEGINKDEIEDKATKKIEAVCRRIFKGFNPAEGGKYFPKDKAYLEGELGALRMKKNGIVDYLYQAKVDPELIPYLIRLGTFVRSKGFEISKQIVIQMWKDKDWPMEYIKDKKWFPEDFIKNREWYEENTQMDRHLAYRKEFIKNNEK